MSVVLLSLVKQRLTAAAEDIFVLFERTISEYEEELSRSKQENERHRKLLDAVLQPQLQIHRADVQQLVVVKEEVPPEQQEWSSSLDQEDPEPPPHIKEEEHCSQGGEQLQGLEEADITKSTFTPVPVKSEDDEEKPQSSQLHQRQTEHLETEADGEDCGGPEPARNSDPERHLQPETEDNPGDCSEPDTEDSADWKETREPDVQQLVVVEEEVPPEQQEWSSSLDQEDPEPPPHIKEEQEELWISQEGEQLQGLEEADIAKSTFTPVPVKSEDDEEKRQSSQLHQRQTEHLETEADGEDCRGPEPARNSDPERHLQPETEDNPGDSSEPDTEDRADLKETREPGSNPQKIKQNPVSDSIRSAGENTFGCSLCEKTFKQRGNLNRHMRIHSGEKTFGCSVCKKSFAQRGNLKQHMRVHTGEKPFICSICKKSFADRGDLKKHTRVHTGEKPFSCSICKKSFARRGHLKEHMRIHTGEKPFSCRVCDKRFIRGNLVKTHKCVGRQSSQLHQTQTEENREAEPPASSSAEHMETEADGEDCGGPEPARNSDPERHLQPETEDNPGDSSEPDSEDSDYC
ncbi:zinc finger protein 436-like [Gymnodraco acuticeps]|uniref:Zinc finger protein 436-like n=1 Tax=Gymnodraco acuticeps TaxID=8218 RepID=A0A6P8V0G4_GYMAC|nr:zinc finger protein 436-like [Gymnodraco acuticeps]